MIPEPGSSPSSPSSTPREGDEPIVFGNGDGIGGDDGDGGGGVGGGSGGGGGYGGGGSGSGGGGGEVGDAAGVDGVGIIPRTQIYLESHSHLTFLGLLHHLHRQRLEGRNRVAVVFKAAWKWSVCIDDDFFTALLHTWDVPPPSMERLTDRVMMFIHINLIFSNHLGPALAFLAAKKSNLCDGIRILFKTVTALTREDNFGHFFFTSHTEEEHNLVAIHMILLELFIKDKRGTSLKQDSYSQLITYLIEEDSEQIANYPHQIEDHIRAHLLIQNPKHQIPGNGLAISACRVKRAAQDVFYKTAPMSENALQANPTPESSQCSVAVTLASGVKYRAHFITSKLLAIFDIDSEGRRNARFLLISCSCRSKCKKVCPCSAFAVIPRGDEGVEDDGDEEQRGEPGEAVEAVPCGTMCTRKIILEVAETGISHEEVYRRAERYLEVTLELGYTNEDGRPAPPPLLPGRGRAPAGGDGGVGAPPGLAGGDGGGAPPPGLAGGYDGGGIEQARAIEEEIEQQVGVEAEGEEDVVTPEGDSDDLARQQLMAWESDDEDEDDDEGAQSGAGKSGDEEGEEEEEEEEADRGLGPILLRNSSPVQRGPKRGRGDR